jgi:hypothetical protein
MPLSKIDEAGLASSAQFTGFKNRIINGDMRIDQRNAGAAITTHGSFVVDRIGTALTNGSASGITVQQSSTVPSDVGFTNSVVYTVGTGGAVGSSGSYGIQQRIEGYNFSDILSGTASAKQFTLSFWVRSSIIGTYGVSFRNSAKDRSYIATYTVNAANTWEYKTITITGDTGGTWLTNNGIGLDLFFDLGAGTSSSTTSGSWQAGNYTGLTGGVKLVETTGATFYITGVQLEKGSTATSFDYRPYGTELQLCQRYYYRVAAQIAGDYTIATSALAISTTQAFVMTNFPVQMRTRPTALEQNGTASDYAVVRAGSATFNACSSVPTFSQAGLMSAMSIFTVASGLTNGSAGYVYGNTTAAYLGWSAEL